jgi:ABC-2 type transport system permease protein
MKSVPVVTVPHFPHKARAIIWAQWRTVRNYLPRSNKASLLFSGLLLAVGYAGFALLGVVVGVILAKPDEIDFIRRVLPASLLMCFLYWQLIPILMASTGAALDMRKLLVYPIPNRELFTLEVLLRISSGIEMLLLLGGAGIGLLMNPKVPFWAPCWLVLFVAFNLLCSAGVRDLLVRLLARKRVREITVLLFVLAAALPQMLVLGGFPSQLRRLFAAESSPYLLWTATARLAEGEFSWVSAGVIVVWTAAAYFFGRWQFERGLTFDFGEAAAKDTPRGRSASRLDWFYQLPNAILPDPLAALFEKELRFLSRAPRFRLVFLMGFSFGILIWFPVAFGDKGSSHSLVGDNYLTFVSVYALLLLSDTLFWNVFGFDRSAAQVYFLVPLKMSTVLVGKNLAAAFFVLLEISAVALVCVLLRLPLTGLRVVEAVAVTLVVTTFLLAIGNVSSMYNPRGVNPGRSFRTAAGARMQALLMLLFPVSLAPVVLAYLARYAFGSEWAFLGVLLCGAMLGGVVYWFSMESAVKTAERRKGQIIAALSQGEGLIQS